MFIALNLLNTSRSKHPNKKLSKWVTVETSPNVNANHFKLDTIKNLFHLWQSSKIRR
jgi:hypothetical protein